MTVAARLVPKGLRINTLWMIKRKLWDVLWFISARGSGGRIRTSPVYPWAIALSLFPLAWCEEYLSKALHTPSTSLGVLWVFFFPLTREDRPNEAIAAPLQRFTLPCYYCQVLSAQAKIGTIKNSFFFFSPLYRTLLALGCRVVHVNPNADSSLKKIKLPKKQVMNACVDCYCLWIALNEV